jgi:integrase
VTAVAAAERPRPVWRLALEDRRYDRDPRLTPAEHAALSELYHTPTAWRTDRSGAVARLTVPIDDVLCVVTPHAAWWGRLPARRALVGAMVQRREAFWAWGRPEWVAVLRDSDAQIRQIVMALAYLTCGQRDLSLEFPGFKARKFASRLFGAAPVDQAIDRVSEHIDRFGQAAVLGRPSLQRAMLDALLIIGSPLLEDLAERFEVLVWLRAHERNNARRYGVEQLTRTLVEMGVLAAMPFATQPSREEWLARSQTTEVDVPTAWLSWTRRWFETSTLARSTRTHTYYALIKTGRWLTAEHPECGDPRAWDRQLAVAWLAAVDRMRVGDFAKSTNTAYMHARFGGPLSARAKASLIWSLRRFFVDLQEWEWIEPRFNPRRAFQAPRSITALIGPKPRVIADDVWAKLMWAGLNLTAEDLPVHPAVGQWYPLELVRAIAVLWLFAGLRVDEIMRLRVGAVRWQQDAGGDQPAVCLLDVPVNKTTTAFTKPVDQLVGQAIQAWEAARPAQPRFEDRRTGERVDMLLAYRGAQLGEKYINRTLIPLLVRKAGVPREDVRGSITGHRARATIASQLYNAKDPMGFFDLQAWLGHSSPQSTQHYVQVTPTRLTKAYTDAGYFARNVRAIEVLVDRQAIQAGAAGSGQPFEFYDLGHGYCTSPSSSNVHTGWRAPAATSTYPSNPARRSCSKPSTDCSGCSSRSHSPTTSAPPSRATTTPSKS